MTKSPYRIAQTVLFSAIGLLTSALLLYLWFTPNVETTHARDTSGYTEVAQVAYSETEDAEGLIRQFRFTLNDEIISDTTLIFRFNHQEADVYLDGDKVYSLRVAQQMHIVHTPGGHWAMIPLYREDVGKEVLVELRPVYDNYQHQEIQFLIGTRLDVYTHELVSALPEMILCLGDVFAGLLLMAIAIYFSFKKGKGSEFYALGSLAIALGLWNFTQTNFAPLIMPDRNIFIYYVSLTMLMISVFALIKSVRFSHKQKIRRMMDIWTLCCALLAVGQLSLQLLGIMDLRETLTITHVTLIVSALVVTHANVMTWWNSRKVTGEKPPLDCFWVLGVGILLDLLNYYTNIITTKLLFVLLAVFIYVLLGGLQMFTIYMKQRQTLEEKETQLTMSRITTMMSQIRSHFVFNVLNAISGLCKYDPEKADETLVRFSRYLRSNINIMEDDRNVPFLQEMEHLEDYVVLEQIRFGDRIEFTTDLEADQFAIPPLILQPIVENAIKHGISKRQEGGKIHLHTRDTGTNIVITITDNGIGFPMDALNKTTSVGLRNIRFRLYHLVGGTMDIKSKLGTGTTVTLTIPKEA